MYLVVYRAAACMVNIFINGNYLNVDVVLKSWTHFGYCFLIKLKNFTKVPVVQIL